MPPPNYFDKDIKCNMLINMFDIHTVMVRISNLSVLERLSENSRMSFIRIAKNLGVSETAIRKRVRKMENEGTIRKYTLDINPKKIGFEVNALIGLDTKPENYLSVIGTLKEIPEIRSLSSSSGDHMILTECWFKNSDELSVFTKKLEAIEGVTRICPAIITEKIK